MKISSQLIANVFPHVILSLETVLASAIKLSLLHVLLVQLNLIWLLRLLKRNVFAKKIIKLFLENVNYVLPYVIDVRV